MNTHQEYAISVAEDRTFIIDSHKATLIPGSDQEHYSGHDISSLPCGFSVREKQGRDDK
jgi:hypothetical protein